MSKNTSILSLSYPEDVDAPNAPAQIKDLAEDVESAILGLNQSGTAKASEFLSIASTTAADIVGAKAEFTLAKKSLVLVNCVWDLDLGIEVSLLSAGKYGLIGLLNVDGSIQERFGEIDLFAYRGGEEAKLRSQATVAQNYILSLAKGSHTLKLQAKRYTAEATSIQVSTATAWAPMTSFTYLALPVA